MLKKLNHFMNNLCFGTSFLGALIVFGLMFLICGDICGRVFFHKPIIGTTEIAQNMTAAIVFLMLPWATKLGQHVRSTMILSKLPKKGVEFMNAASYLLGIILFIGIIVSSWDPMVHATKIKDVQGEVFSFPLYPIWWIVIFGSAMSLYQCFRKFIEAVAALFRNSSKIKTNREGCE
ncbi:TRAP transporter small permease subunit [Sinanaerobacter chloroacetimidivorans]|uniref:TRAP transporter small permease n=1 Tax=Sinanaerobacter chloroacetimidivorans TaxID=2818044 RepID=A0A8J7W1I4_9FIRM|nr:TRAP transporter small permease [Sinanaerobacter chloroacetimidivorans]MBR0597465.1 TRAP transporter small permease [Sinanaerobacter chloroacetimidivorans]